MLTTNQMKTLICQLRLLFPQVHEIDFYQNGSSVVLHYSTTQATKKDNDQFDQLNERIPKPQNFTITRGPLEGDRPAIITLSGLDTKALSWLNDLYQQAITPTPKCQCLVLSGQAH